jgi:hypothetical protein
MKTQDYTVNIQVDVRAEEAFKGIHSVTKWWTENLEGNSQTLHDEFTVQFGDVHFSRQKLIEVVPYKKIVWLVTESKLNFLRKDKQEWNNTKIGFDIVEHEGKTQITFTHYGLVPQIECYNDCANAWSQYIKGSLFKLLTTGRGMPELKRS